MKEKGGVWGEELAVMILFILTTSVYVSSTYGMHGSNTGSHYALVRAMAEDQSFKINKYVTYTGGIDMAVYENNAYSDRAPGLALTSMPFYLAGKVASIILPMPSYMRGWDAGNPAAFIMLLVPAIAGGLAVVFLYLICRNLGGSVQAAAVAALTLGLATILWKHSSMFFSHSMSAFLLTASIYLALTLKDIKKQRLHSYALFFALGYMVLVEYANMLLTIMLLAYIVLTKKLTVKQALSMKKEYLYPLACLALPILFIPAYNQVNFGNFMTTAYKYSPHHAWVGDLSQALSTPITEGLPALLITNQEIDGGLFVVTPALIIALWGLPYLYRSRPRETILLMALFMAHLLFYGKYRTYNGGSIRDARYLITVTPLIVAPIFAWIDGFLSQRKTHLERVIYGGILCILLAVSIINVAQDVATEEGHGTRQFVFPVLTWDQLMLDYGNTFGNLPLLPAYLGILAMLYSAASYRLKRPLGFTLKKGDRERFAKMTGVVFIAGFLSLVYASSAPSGDWMIHRLSYSADGLRWGAIEPPYKSNTGMLFVKGTLSIPDPQASIVLGVSAEDCVKRIYVNTEKVFPPEGVEVPCDTCMHCSGIRLDMAQLIAERKLQAGDNSIWFEVEGLHNSTSFMVQKLT